MIRFCDLKTGKETNRPSSFIAALGDFDGVHIGHRRVILEAVSAAKEAGVSGAAWFFSDSPKGSTAKLTDNSEKERIFASLDIDYSITENFDKIKNLSPGDFVKDYLVSIGCCGVVCGFNFRFGKNAAGNVDVLSSLCRESGLTFKAVEPITFDGETVSSTRIRALLAEGNVDTAEKMLGRPYSVTGEVEHGRTLGYKFGFPTINQNFIGDKVVPRHGVYFTYTEIDGSLFPSVSNVGSRPTVGGHVCRLETHILNCSADLYGKTLTVYFAKFRRPEMTFKSEDELINAISEDKAAAANFFSENKNMSVEGDQKYDEKK